MKFCVRFVYTQHCAEGRTFSAVLEATMSSVELPRKGDFMYLMMHGQDWETEIEKVEFVRRDDQQASGCLPILTPVVVFSDQHEPNDSEDYEIAMGYFESQLVPEFKEQGYKVQHCNEWPIPLPLYRVFGWDRT